jgi:hypothetical protein
MKKGFFKSFAAVVMAITMALGMTTFATASQNGAFKPIEGVGTPAELAVQVTVPLSLPFKIDPMNDDPSQFLLANVSKYPVLISYNLNLNVGDNIDRVATFSELQNNGLTSTYSTTGQMGVVFGIEGAENFGNGAASAGEYASAAGIATIGQATPSEFTYAATLGEATGFAPAATSTGLMKADFLLAAGSGTELAANGAGMAAFRLNGEYTRGGDWATANMTVTGVYTTLLVNQTAYAEYTEGNAKATDNIAMNMIELADADRPVPPSSEFEFVVFPGKTANVEISKAKASNSELTIEGGSSTAGYLKVMMSGKPASITGIFNATAAFNLTTASGKWYEYDPATGILILAAPTAAAGSDVAYSFQTPLGTSAVQFKMIP